MPVPGLTWLTVLFTLYFKPVNEILQCVRGLLKDLMKERPPEVKRCLLELIITIMEEEREYKGATSGFVFIKSIF